MKMIAYSQGIKERLKKQNKNKVLRCPPCSGETTNTKCLPRPSIFLNVNREGGEVKRGAGGCLSLARILTVA